MNITKLTRVSSETLKDIKALVVQLRENPSDHRVTMSHLKEIVAGRKIVCMVAKDGKKIVGMATVYILQKFGKRVAHVEDVVVDSAYRGQGLGEKLVLATVDTARAKKVITLTLTSRPTNIAANKLYQKLGFERYETNVYKMKL